MRISDTLRDAADAVINLAVFLRAVAWTRISDALRGAADAVFNLDMFLSAVA